MTKNPSGALISTESPALHPKQVRRKNSFVHQVQAQLETISIGQRDDGVRPRDLLAAQGLPGTRRTVPALNWRRSTSGASNTKCRTSGAISCDSMRTALIRLSLRRPRPRSPDRAAPRAELGCPSSGERDLDLDVSVLARDILHQTRQIALQVRAQRQEIRYHHDRAWRRARPGARLRPPGPACQVRETRLRRRPWRPLPCARRHRARPDWRFRRASRERRRRIRSYLDQRRRFGGIVLLVRKVRVQVADECPAARPPVVVMQFEPLQEHQHAEHFGVADIGGAFLGQFLPQRVDGFLDLLMDGRPRPDWWAWFRSKDRSRACGRCGSANRAPHERRNPLRRRLRATPPAAWRREKSTAVRAPGETPRSRATSRLGMSSGFNSGGFRAAVPRPDAGSRAGNSR